MFARGDLENVRSPRGDAVSPLTLQRRPHAQTEDSHRGHKGQKEGHEGNMKVVRTGRFPSPCHFLESSKALATLSDLCDLCVNLFEFPPAISPFGRLSWPQDNFAARPSAFGKLMRLPYLRKR